MIPLSRHLPGISSLAFGCMGLGGSWDSNSTTAEQQRHAFSAIDAALANGINFFDHADIYTRGKAEQVFGQYLAAAPAKRAELFIQTKCAIRFADDQGPGRYDFSKDYIIRSVEQSLTRLNTGYLDLLLLHRPDPLMQPEQVAQAFEQLVQQGKVRHFGVSNMGWAQMQWLQSALSQPLLVNQLQMSLADIDWLEEIVLTGMSQGSNKHFSYGTVEYCQQQGVQLQSWGSLAKGAFSGAQTQTDTERATAALVAQLAEQYQCSREAIVLAWLMRHPAAIQPVIGTANPQRIAACAGASQVHLSREHWYQLYISSRGAPLP
jgi:predicted oxidoreductase